MKLEKHIEQYPAIISLEKSKKINEQIQNCICKIYIGYTGTGFFCYIKNKKTNQQIPVMITNNHVIDENYLNQNKSIKISFNEEKVFKDIKLNNKKIYTNKNLDITIIEIKNEDEINNNRFLEIDERIYQDNNPEVFFINKSAYVIQYPKDIGASVSYGIITGINIDNNKIYHFCITDKGSSGSPILNLESNKIIGVHRGYFEEPDTQNKGLFEKSKDYNEGIFLKYPINAFFSIQNNNEIKTPLNNYNYQNTKTSKSFNETNEINIIVKIEKSGDLNKKIYFLDNTNDSLDRSLDKAPHSYLSELNQNNTELFIDNKQYQYQKYFKPSKLKNYEIKLKFTKNLTDCSHMFFYCTHIIYIDFSNFKTDSIINMSNMFCYCTELTDLNLSSFNTENVKDMSNMFAYCSNLKSIDLSSFNIKNVNTMKNMFAFCNVINSINISSFIYSSKININNMFERCWKLEKLHLNKKYSENFRKEAESLGNSNLYIIYS